VICEERGHINQYEMASIRPLPDALHALRAHPRHPHLGSDRPLIRPRSLLPAQTALISLENTHNMAVGTVYPLEVAEDICDTRTRRTTRASGCARIFNAAVALGRKRRRAHTQIRL